MQILSDDVIAVCGYLILWIIMEFLKVKWSFVEVNKMTESLVQYFEVLFHKFYIASCRVELWSLELMNRGFLLIMFLVLYFYHFLGKSLFDANRKKFLIFQFTSNCREIANLAVVFIHGNFFFFMTQLTIPVIKLFLLLCSRHVPLLSLSLDGRVTIEFHTIHVWKWSMIVNLSLLLH